MMKWFLLASAVWLAASSCDDLAPINPPEPMVVYKNLHDVRAGYNHAFLLDIDEDGVGEYLVTASLIGTQQGVETHFKIYPSRGNRILASEGFPVIMQQGGNIGGDSFTKFVEPMVIKVTTGNTINWYGDWRDADSFYAGIQFQLKNENYRYGWLRLSFDQAHEQFVIHDMAFENAPGKSITAGEIQQ